MTTLDSSFSFSPISPTLYDLNPSFSTPADLATATQSDLKPDINETPVEANPRAEFRFKPRQVGPRQRVEKKENPQLHSFIQNQQQSKEVSSSKEEEENSDWDRIIEKNDESDTIIKDNPLMNDSSEKRTALQEALEAERIFQGLMKREKEIKRANKKGQYIELQYLWVPGKEGYHDSLTQREIVEAVKKADRRIEQKTQRFAKIIQECKAKPISHRAREIYKQLDSPIVLTEEEVKGHGSTYYLGEELVITPMGGGIHQVHNKKGFADLSANSWVGETSTRAYEEVQRKVAAYYIAKKIGIQQITPPTVMDILECIPNPSEKIIGFNYITGRLDPKKYPYLHSELKPSYKRVCAIQEKIKDSCTLFQFIKDWEKTCGIKNITKDDIRKMLAEKISYHDCLLICIWLLITGDNDGNLANFLVYKNKKDLYRLMKIDEGETWPERNKGSEIRNELLDLLLDPNKPIDLSIKLLCKDIRVEDIASFSTLFGLKRTVAASEVRISALKGLLEEFPNISIKELHYRMSKLNRDHQSADIKDSEIFADLTEKEIKENNLSISSRKISRAKFQDLQRYFTKA